MRQERCYGVLDSGRPVAPSGASVGQSLFAVPQKEGIEIRVCLGHHGISDARWKDDLISAGTEFDVAAKKRL